MFLWTLLHYYENLAIFLKFTTQDVLEYLVLENAIMWACSLKATTSILLAKYSDLQNRASVSRFFTYELVAHPIFIQTLWNFICIFTYQFSKSRFLQISNAFNIHEDITIQSCQVHLRSFAALYDLYIFYSSYCYNIWKIMWNDIDLVICVTIRVTIHVTINYKYLKSTS